VGDGRQEEGALSDAITDPNHLPTQVVIAYAGGTGLCVWATDGRRKAHYQLPSFACVTGLCVTAGGKMGAGVIYACDDVNGMVHVVPTKLVMATKLSTTAVTATAAAALTVVA